MSNVTTSRVIKTLAIAIAKMMKEHNVSQKELAEKAGLGETNISRISCEHVQNISLENAMRLAVVVNIDPMAVMKEYIQDKLDEHKNQNKAAAWQALASRLQFCRHPGLEINLIIRGDRRDIDNPQSEADLLANAPSTIDLYFLGSLGAPPTIMTDQIIFDGNGAFDDGDWLSIASPSVNLCTRELNASACFRFGFSSNPVTQYESLKQVLKKNDNWRDPALLKRLCSMREQFRDAYVIDPFGSDHKLSRRLSGIITFACHPRNKNRVAIVAAGTRGPATAVAVSKLSDPQLFQDLPFGGVFSVPEPGNLGGVTKVEQLRDGFRWETKPYTVTNYVEAARTNPQFKDWFEKDGSDLVHLIRRRRINSGQP